MYFPSLLSSHPKDQNVLDDDVIFLKPSVNAFWGQGAVEWLLQGSGWVFRMRLITYGGGVWLFPSYATV
jgi:hypothetical protein